MLDSLSNFSSEISNQNIIFIDSQVENYTSLVSGVEQAEVIIIDSTNDGINQITEALGQYENIASIQIVSHGDIGSLQIGTTNLNSDNIEQYSYDLQQWSQHLSEDGDILLLGCKIGSDSAFMQSLSDFTQADVAASDNLTGYADLSGDWQLEIAIGEIESEIAISPIVLDNYESVLAISETDLILELDFADFDNNTVQDTSPNGNTNNGQLAQGATITTEAEPFAEVLKLNDNNDQLRIANSNDINLGIYAKRTVSVWFNADNVNLSTPQVIYEEGAQVRGLNIYIDQGQLYVGGWNSSASQSAWSGTYLNTPNISSDTWHHVALVLDAAPGIAAVQPDVLFAYLDGVEVARGEGSQLWSHSSANFGGINQQTKLHSGVTNFNRSLIGKLDEARVYNQALTAQEVAELADISNVADPLVAQFNLDETIGNQAADFQDNSSGTLNNGAVFFPIGDELGGGVVFDGKNDYVAIANDPEINVGIHAKRTVSVWFNAEDISRSIPQVIYEEGGKVRGLNIYIDQGQLYVGGWNTSASESGWVGTYLNTPSISSNNWHHVALVLDAVPNIAAVQPDVLFAYLDGVKVGQGAGSQLWNRPAGIGLGGLNKDTRFHSGFVSGTGIRGFEGNIASLEIYNKALTPSMIANLVNLNVPAPPVQTGQFNYGEVLQKNFLFYEANRSGDLDGDIRIEWRGDATLNDGADVNRDLAQGYFDAGDHIKFIQPLAFSMTMLAWGGVDYAQAYQNSGQIDELREAVKWGTDWLLEAHETDVNGDTERLWVQVGDASDHQVWVAPETIDQVTTRPSFAIDRQNPGSDVAASTASALASASLLFRGVDDTYANELLENAIQLYEFAETYQGKYSDSVSEVNPFYTSTGYFDELSEGGSWLYRATEDSEYLTKAEDYFFDQEFIFLGDWTYATDDHSYGAAALLAKESINPHFKQEVQKYLGFWIDGQFSVQISPEGFAFRNIWGSAPLALSTAFIAEWYNDNVEANATYSTFATEQLDYILGDNPNEYSYVVGFGNNYPLRIHHRGSAGNAPLPLPPSPENDSSADSLQENEHILYGALVGGPRDANDSPHNDLRNDFITNEVGISFNAPLANAAIQQYDNFGGEPLSEAMLDQLIGIDANGVGN